jgi:hypothetical protein
MSANMRSIEVAVSQVGILAASDDKLPSVRRSGRVDSAILQAAKMVVPEAWVNDVEGLVAPLNSFLDKRQKYAVFLVRGIEERTDVPVGSKRSICKTNGLVA